MIDRRKIEEELIDISRFAHLARHVAANTDFDPNSVSRLVSMIDLLVNHIDGMEQRLMDALFPPLPAGPRRATA